MTKLLIGIISFISLSANAADYPVTFLINSKCKVSRRGYETVKPINFDPKVLPRWKKDLSEKNLYVYEGAENQSLSFQDHIDLIEDFLHKTTMPSGFQMANDSEHTSVTCTAKGDEQEITFYHNYASTSAICNAAGGAEFMKQMYPLVKWTELPKVPHYYVTDYIDEYRLLNTVKTLPEGCRHRDRGMREN